MAKYRCPDCGYIYDETAGHPHEGFLPGTPWSAVPQSWCCPDCAVRDKVDFELIERSPVAAPHSAAMVATRSAPTAFAAAIACGTGSMNRLTRTPSDLASAMTGISRSASAGKLQP